MRSAGTIFPGDFNIVFTVAYGWDHESKRYHSFVTVEKPLKARVLGSESIAGIPLNLAAFIVPGLLFWLVLSHAGVSWAVGNIALGDRMVYSLLVSVFLLMIGDWMKLVDADAAIGTARLASLGLAGAGAGLFVASLHHGVRWLVRTRKKASYIKESDDIHTKLTKLLKANAIYRHPRATVRIAENGVHEYLGSLAAEMGGTVWLAGWFRLVLPSDDGLAAAIQADYKAGQLRRVLQTARRHGLQVTPRDLIREVSQDGQQPTNDYLRAWETGTIRIEEDPEEKQVLELVETPRGRHSRPLVD
jgi:hypothetical protein